MIQLIACDMDGTLLDSAKRLPPDLPRVLNALRARGVRFAVASGRQYAALHRDLCHLGTDILYICENGALVMDGGKQLLLDPIPARELPAILAATRELPGVYPVVCRAETALVARTSSEPFVQGLCHYYPSVAVVDDLAEHCAYEDVCKVAFYDEGDAATHELPALQAALGDRLAVILSGEQWVDVMKPGVHKGSAMRAMQERLGIAPQDCMAFGDYLNDVELLEAVGESYAMANAYPPVKRVARHIAPSNDEDGVLRVVRAVFSLGEAEVRA